MPHLWIQATEVPPGLSLPPLLLPPVEADRRRLGPYAATGALLRAVVPEALDSRPDLVAAHDIEIRAAAPDLRDLVPARRTSLAAGLPREERILVPAPRRTLRIANGLTEFLRELPAAGDRPRAIVVTGVTEADFTDAEMVAVMLRRLDPEVISLAVAAPAGGTPKPLAAALARHARPVRSPATQASPQRRSDVRDLGDPRAHDRRAEALLASGEIAPRLGAVPFHRERGTDRGLALRAFEFAVEHCFDEGFHHAVAELGERALAVAEQVNEPDAWWRLIHRTATAYASTGREERARELLDRARRLSTDPERHAAAAYATAMLFVRHHDPARRDLDAALPWLNEAIAISALLPDPETRGFKLGFDLNAKALVEARRGRLAEASRLVERAIELAEEHLPRGRHPIHRLILRANRAQLKIMEGRPKEAVPDYDAVIDADPGYPDYYIDRGNLLHRLGRDDEAIADYEAAMRAGPPFPEPYYNRAEIRFAHGDLERALADLDYALELDPEFADAYIDRAGILIALGDVERARRDTQEGLRLRPGSAHLWCVLGQIEMAEGRPAEAGGAFGAALDRDASLAAAWASRGTLAYESGDADGAVADLTRAIELGEEATLRYNRAVALRALGREDEAVADLRRAHELDPDDEAVRDALAASGG